MSAAKRIFEDVGYKIGAIIREDLPDWPNWFEEDDENGSLEEQVVNLLLTCQLDMLLYILWDLATECSEPPIKALKAIQLVDAYKHNLTESVERHLVYGAGGILDGK